MTVRPQRTQARLAAVGCSATTLVACGPTHARFDRDADSAQAGCLGFPARAGCRLGRGRHRGCGRQSGGGAVAAQPAANEVVAAGHRRRRHAAAGDRPGTEQGRERTGCWRRCAGHRPREQRAAAGPGRSDRRGPAAAAAAAHSRREGPRAVRAALRQHDLLETHR